LLQKKERVTYGSMSLDIDNDGDTDLIVAQTFGIFVYLNNGDHFSEKRINPLLGLETYGVPVSLTAGDINKDSGQMEFGGTNYIILLPGKGKI